MEMMQRAVLDTMRLYFKAAFLSADIAQDQGQKAWNLIVEQNGKLRNELEDFTAAWIANAKRARDEIQLNLEKSLGAVEEGLVRTDSGSPLRWELVQSWPEMQAEALRAWMHLWGIQLDTTAKKDEGDKAEGHAAKGK